MNSAAHVGNDITNWKAMGLSKAEMTVLIAEDCLGWPYVYGERGAYCTAAVRRNRANALDAGMPAEAKVIRNTCQVLKGTKSDCSGCRYYPGDAKTRCFDCRGFTYWVLQQVGITISGSGATSQWNTDANWKAKGKIADLPSGQICCVFMHNSRNGKMEHTGLHVGNGKVIHCSGEVKVGKITDKGWTHFAVPNGMEGDGLMPDTNHTPNGTGGNNSMPTSKPTLRKGSSGDSVRECQEALLKLGYSLGSYGADGKYGNRTVEAVKDFQRDRGLEADGVCGPKTWAALDAAAGGGSTGFTAGSDAGGSAGSASSSAGSDTGGSAGSAGSPAGSAQNGVGTTPITLYTVHIPKLRLYEAEAYVSSIPGAWMTREGE